MTARLDLLRRLLIGVLFLAAAPLQAHAQFVQVKVDEIVAGVVTDRLTPCDEVYFVLAGASDHDGPINGTIRPCGSRDIFEFCPNQSRSNIQLWRGFVANGQSAFLTVLVREQDNAQLSAIVSLIQGAAELFGAIFLNPALGGAALNDLKNAAEELVDSFSNDADDTIGAFTVRITNQNNVFTASWDTIRDTGIVSSSAAAAHFSAIGADANYSIRVSIEPVTVTESGNLLWYENEGWTDGTRRWATGSSRRVGQGWQGFLSVFATTNGVIYGIKTNGDLLWYRHEGYEDGASRWACNSGAVVGTGWAGLRSVFATSNGVIYGIDASGDLRWYKHDGWTDGTRRWGSGTGAVVGTGWAGLRSVFATSNGVIYGIDASGDLRWYKHDGWTDGTRRWASGTGAVVGTGWAGLRSVFATSNGVIHGIQANGDLLWYKHDGWADGTRRWATGSGSRVVGNGWAGFRSVFATNNGVIYGILP
jgi:hypothetical protein